MAATTLFPGVALVTGAGSGIGRQTALSFAAEGCRRIAVLDQSGAGLDETKAAAEAAAAGVAVLAVRADVRSEANVVAAVDQVAARFGRIDYAVNFAGIFGPTKPSYAWRAAEFDDIVGVNLRGLWLCAREQARRMMAQEPLPTHDGRPGCRGSIVNMASNLAIVVKEGTPAYSASKTAIVGLTRTDAVDAGAPCRPPAARQRLTDAPQYSPHNIRVNCVCPGVDTPITADMADDAPGVLVAPMKRKGTPKEVADVVLFLSSSKASFIQGASLTVDGGYVIN